MQVVRIRAPYYLNMLNALRSSVPTCIEASGTVIDQVYLNREGEKGEREREKEKEEERKRYSCNSFLLVNPRKKGS